MIGMNFLSFLLLLGIGVVVAIVLHYGLRYRFLDGWDAIFAKVAVGWLGGWLGSPVLGYWSYKVQNIYLVPAILGSIAAVMLSVTTLKALEKAFAGHPAAEKGAPSFPKAA